MSKFIKHNVLSARDDSELWIHEDFPMITYPEKPPEWMAERLVRMYDYGWDRGEASVQDRIRDALGFLDNSD